MLPREVMQEVYNEFFDYKNSGLSVLELNHRSILFNEIVYEAKEDLRELLNIPSNYSIIFLQGGASLQFSAVPMNLMKIKKAGFIVTGHWAKRAMEEAALYGETIELTSSGDRNYSYIPDCSNLGISEELDYVHYCENNTIYGTQFKDIPNVGNVNLVCDMSSCLLSEPIDIEKYALIYAGAQKNMGPAGTTVVIVRNDLVSDDVLTGTPFVMRYKKQIDNDSRYNTPPCYGIYMCGKVFKWLKRNGGVETIHEINKTKAEMLYDYIDNSKLFEGTAEIQSRSLMNVTFTTGDPNLDMVFVEDSKRQGFVSLKGHRFVGGLRATLYNAIPKEQVAELIDYMKKFERNN